MQQTNYCKSNFFFLCVKNSWKTKNLVVFVVGLQFSSKLIELNLLSTRAVIGQSTVGQCVRVPFLFSASVIRLLCSECERFEFRIRIYTRRTKTNWHLFISIGGRQQRLNLNILQEFLRFIANWSWVCNICGRVAFAWLVMCRAMWVSRIMSNRHTNKQKNAIKLWLVLTEWKMLCA